MFSPHEQKDQFHFTRWAARYDRGFSGFFFRKSYQKVLSFFPPKSGDNIVDLACGTGGFISALLKKEPNLNIVGIDYTEAMLDQAGPKFAGNDNVQLVASSAEKIPLAEKSVDIVYCLDAFHHFEHPDEVLREVKRVLKIDGKFVILDPVDDGWRWIMHLVMPFMGESHTFVRNSRQWRELLGRHGFEIEYEERWAGFFKLFVSEKIKRLKDCATVS